MEFRRSAPSTPWPRRDVPVVSRSVSSSVERHELEFRTSPPSTPWLRCRDVLAASGTPRPALRSVERQAVAPKYSYSAPGTPRPQERDFSSLVPPFPCAPRTRLEAPASRAPLVAPSPGDQRKVARTDTHAPRQDFDGLQAPGARVAQAATREAPQAPKAAPQACADPKVSELVRRVEALEAQVREVDSKASSALLDQYGFKAESELDDFPSVRKSDLESRLQSVESELSVAAVERERALGDLRTGFDQRLQSLHRELESAILGKQGRIDLLEAQLQAGCNMFPSARLDCKPESLQGEPKHIQTPNADQRLTQLESDFASFSQRMQSLHQKGLQQEVEDSITEKRLQKLEADVFAAPSRREVSTATPPLHFLEYDRRLQSVRQDVEEISSTVKQHAAMFTNVGGLGDLCMQSLRTELAKNGSEQRFSRIESNLDMAVKKQEAMLADMRTLCDQHLQSLRQRLEEKVALEVSAVVKLQGASIADVRAACDQRLQSMQQELAENLVHLRSVVDSRLQELEGQALMAQEGDGVHVEQRLQKMETGLSAIEWEQKLVSGRLKRLSNASTHFEERLQKTELEFAIAGNERGDMINNLRDTVQLRLEELQDQAVEARKGGGNPEMEQKLSGMLDDVRADFNERMQKMETELSTTEMTQKFMHNQLSDLRTDFDERIQRMETELQAQSGMLLSPQKLLSGRRIIDSTGIEERLQSMECGFSRAGKEQADAISDFRAVVDLRLREVERQVAEARKGDGIQVEQRLVRIETELSTTEREQKFMSGMLSSVRADFGERMQRIESELLTTEREHAQSRHRPKTRDFQTARSRRGESASWSPGALLRSCQQNMGGCHPQAARIVVVPPFPQEDSQNRSLRGACS